MRGKQCSIVLLQSLVNTGGGFGRSSAMKMDCINSTLCIERSCCAQSTFFARVFFLVVCSSEQLLLCASHHNVLMSCSFILPYVCTAMKKASELSLCNSSQEHCRTCTKGTRQKESSTYSCDKSSYMKNADIRTITCTQFWTFQVACAPKAPQTCADNTVSRTCWLRNM